MDATGWLWALLAIPASGAVLSLVLRSPRAVLSVVSLGVFGTAGRELGQLAFPWAVAVDGSRKAYVVDSGNNRVQVWQL